MSFATAIRFALFTGWLALFVSHALHHALPALGLQARDDTAAMLWATLERRFTYLVVEDADGGAGQVRGSCTLALKRDERDERRYLYTTELRLDDQRLDQLIGALLPAASAPAYAPHLGLTISETLDQRLQLVALDAHAEVHGHHLHAQAQVGGDGLRGEVALDGAAAVPFALPEIGAETAQGLDATLSLPAGLTPGSRFTAAVVSPDSLRLSAHRAVTVFQVKARERIPTRDGERELLRVELEVEGRPFSALWCDDQGTVYLSRQHGAHWALALERVVDLADAERQLWPTTP